VFEKADRAMELLESMAAVESTEEKTDQEAIEETGGES